MRTVLRVAAWTVAGVLLLAVLLVGGILIAGNTPGGRALIERETAQLTSGNVRIFGLAGTFPAQIDLAGIELRDPAGIWMTADHLSLRWAPLALVTWDLHVRSLTAGKVVVLRKPQSAPPSGKSSGGSSLSLPGIDLDRLAIGTLALEPALAGMEARLSVQGSAHYRSMQDARASLVARRTNGRGDYELALRLDRSRMNATLKLEEPAGGPIEHLASLPGLGALSVDASLDGPRSAERVRLRARAGALEANAQGTLDLERRSADLTYAVESPAMTPRPDLSWQRIALQGRWQGPLTAPQADGTLDIESLRLPDGSRIGALKAALRGDRRLLTVRATASGILLPGSGFGWLQESPIDVDAALRLDAADRPLDLTVKHRLFDLQARARTAGARSATFRLSLPDVAPVAAAYAQDIRGSLDVSGRAAQSGQTIRLDVDGTGSLGGASRVAELLGADARLRLAAGMTPSTVRVESLSLSGHALSVTASGSADRSPPGSSAGPVRAIRARWQLSLPDLSLIAPAVAGSLETTGTAAGPMKSLTADVRARSTLSVRGSPAGKVDATLRAKGLPSAPSGVLTADGTFDGAPLRLDASVQRVQGRLYHLVVQRTQWKSLSINGDLTAGSNLAAGHGKLALRIDRLADLQRFVGSAISGSIDASAALIPSAGRPRARLELNASNVSAAGISGNARMSAVGPLDAVRIELTAQSPDLRGEPASLSTAARLDEPARTVDLDRLEVGYHGQTVRLLAPSRVSFGRGLEVRRLRLGAQKAVVALDGELSPALDLKASVEQVDAALVSAFVPDLLSQGTFSATARLRGSRSAPVGRATVRIAGLKLANDAAQGLPAIDVRGSARFRGGTADLSAQLDAGAASRIRMSGRAPLDAAGPIALKLAGHMDAALVNSFMEARGERAAGTITVDASVSGTAREPQIGGTVRLENGDLRDYAQGVHLGDINARLVGENGVLRVASMTARAGPGQLSATGTVGVLQPGMPVDLRLTAKDIQPITNDVVTARLDTDMRVAGTLRKRIDVTGTVHIDRASINIPNGFPPSVAVLDVVRPGEKQRAAPLAPRLVIGLGITMSAPEAIFVEGRGLNAQLGGTLKVAGTSADPQVSGGFSMIRGTFALAGTQINFTSGRVSFSGEGLKGKIDPTLDFVAKASVTYTTPTTVTLRVTGFADAPKLSLTSVPPLPQDDLLGLLLFGKPASQLSAIELAEVGGGLASLAGGSGGGGGGGTLSKLNPLNWVRKALGLNTFSVGGAPATGGAASGGNQVSGASVTAGKYISNKVYVAATQTTTGTSQVQVDIDLSRHLKLQTRLGNGTATAQGTTPQNDPGSSIGLSYQFQY